MVSSYPIGEILHNRDVNGRVVKWSVKLGKLNLDFCPRHAIKSQILADFVAEWTEIQKPLSLKRPEHWTMYFDGALNLEGAGAGSYSYPPKASSSSMCSRSTTRPPIIALSTKLSSMAYASLFSASTAPPVLVLEGWVPNYDRRASAAPPALILEGWASNSSQRASVVLYILTFRCRGIFLLRYNPHVLKDS